jgi:hypothetical protein
MSRVKLRAYKARACKSAIFIFFLAIFVLLNCTGAPKGASPTLWEKVAAVPSGAVCIFAEEDDRIWLGGAENEEAVIWRWDGVDLREEFRLLGVDSVIRDLDFREGTGWAAGSVDDAVAGTGLVMKYDRGEWTRVANVPETRFGFFKLSAVSRDVCWFLGSGSAFKYAGGTWARFGDFPNARDIAFTEKGRGFITTDMGPYIWAFDGSAWVRENIVLPPGLSTYGLNGTAAVPGAVFSNCVLSWDELPDFYYGAILKRDGAAPGEGTYELVFFAPPGPYFYGIKALAFADSENGVAVGYLTSVVCGAGIYNQEIVPLTIGNPLAVTALSPGDYWMLGNIEPEGNYLAKYKK